MHIEKNSVGNCQGKGSGENMLKNTLSLVTSAAKIIGFIMSQK